MDLLDLQIMQFRLCIRRTFPGEMFVRFRNQCETVLDWRSRLVEWKIAKPRNQSDKLNEASQSQAVYYDCAFIRPHSIRHFYLPLSPITFANAFYTTQQNRKDTKNGKLEISISFRSRYSHEPISAETTHRSLLTKRLIDWRGCVTNDEICCLPSLFD